MNTSSPDSARPAGGPYRGNPPGSAAGPEPARFTPAAGGVSAGAQAGAQADEQAIAAAIDGLISLLIRGGPRDISLTAAATMATLERSGPCRLTGLAEIEGVAQPSMSTLVTGLERAGLAQRQASPDDGRVVLVALTPEGSRYLQARRQARAERLADLIRLLPAGQAAALAAAVPAMTSLRDLEARRRMVLTRGVAAGQLRGTK